MNSVDILHTGAHISIPMVDGTVRNCEVIFIDEAGFTVRFFTPEGLGPFVATLPHGVLPEKTITRTLYDDERGGPHRSYWKWHADMGGDEGDYRYIKRQIKTPNR